MEIAIQIVGLVGYMVTDPQFLITQASVVAICGLYLGWR